MTNMKIASEVQCTVVVVGDSRTGKTSLIQRFVNNTFNQTYTPTSFDKSFGSQEVNKHTVHFNFWDTSGSPAYDSVRPLSYQDADVFLLCYKISDPISLYNIKNKWIRELRSHREDLPVVLCGCQADLRNDPVTLSHLGKTGRTPVTTDQALAICCEISAINYIETSAKSPDELLSNTSSANSLAEVFELCALAAIKHKNSLNIHMSNPENKTKERHGNNKRDESLDTSTESNSFKRSPSINSTMSLFTDTSHLSFNGSSNSNNNNCIGAFKRSPSTNSNLSLSANMRLASTPQPQISSSVKRGYLSPKDTPTSPAAESDYGFNENRSMGQVSGKLPPLQSPSFSECDSRLSTFSPEPLSESSALPGPNRRRVPNVVPSRGMGKPPRRSTSGTCIAAVGGLNTNNVNLTKPYYRHSAIVSTSDFEARIPPVISENETYHTFYQHSNFSTFTPKSSCSELSHSSKSDDIKRFQSPPINSSSECGEEGDDEFDSKTLTKRESKENDHAISNVLDCYSKNTESQQQVIYDFGGGRRTVVANHDQNQHSKNANKPQRPTTLFKPNTSYYKTTVIPSEPKPLASDIYGFNNTPPYVTPSGDPHKRMWPQAKGRASTMTNHRASLIYISGHQNDNNFKLDEARRSNSNSSNLTNNLNTELITPQSMKMSIMGMKDKGRNEPSQSEIGHASASPDLGYVSPTSGVGASSESTSSCFGQIRPNCLSRRTSHRTNQKVSIPVAAPMSPVDGNPLPSSGRGSECSFEIKSPSQQSVVSSNSSSSCCLSPFGNRDGTQTHLPRMMMRRYPTLPEDESCSENGSVQELQSRDVHFNNNNHPGRIPVFDQSLKPYESLKSQISNSSQSSTGSKFTSSSSSDKSSISRGCVPSSHGTIGYNHVSNTADISKRGYHPPHHHGNKLHESAVSNPISIDTTLCDETLQEETIKGLSFVSPKSGVYRPMPDGRKHRQNCVVM